MSGSDKEGEYHGDEDIYCPPTVSKAMYWVSTIGAVTAILVVAQEMHAHHDETHLIAWWTAGLFVLLACILSFVDVYGHLSHYNNPELQCHIVRIIWMVPIYAVDSFLSLRFHEFELYFDTIRDGYEGYVIYNFLALLIKVLGSDEKAAEVVDSKEPIPHMFPMCKMTPWKGKEFVKKNKFGALQYLIVQLVCTVFVFITRYFRVYDEGHFSWHHGYVYRMSVTNVSQVIAMYCLVLFFHGLNEELQRVKPLGKLMCVKAVVFFSFWQSIAIAILVKYGVLHGTQHYPRSTVAHGIQNFAICLEMCIAAIAHTFTFSYHDFDSEDGRPQKRTPVLASLWHSLSVADIARDMKEMCGCGPRDDDQKDIEVSGGEGEAQALLAGDSAEAPKITHYTS